VRIIAGILKGRRLQAPPPGDLLVRPTADRAREALFSILLRFDQGPFLDLFAGTGAVGLEAFSRGYGPVACVEKEPRALACLGANLRATGVELVAKDARRLAPDAFREQAVIFCDPPYETTLEAWAALAPRLRTWLAADGVLVWEAGHPTQLPPVDGLELLESRRYGAAVFHLLRRS
jgi:16S rRNA (guanine966-N2)-methyltransferase